MNGTFTDYDADRLPRVVLSYLDARDRKDHAEAAGTFAPDATVLDDGHTYEGIDTIRAWIRNASSEYTFTSTRLGQQITDEETVTVRIRLDGDFPGGTVVLRHQFQLGDDAIRRLTIAI
ncbi:nuclear transport factor 2 family protein [Amycolatopsis sp. NPDC051045]|uniref:nuclear transport factor 2 family protein n=1 Tax=Amycolatopsis sp. NPDC051045 TaxID=3156922 RepID=UPI00344159A0